MRFLIVKDRKSFIREKLDEETSFSCLGFSVSCRKGRFYMNTAVGFRLEDGRKTCRLETGKYVVCDENMFHELEIYVYKSDEGIDSFSFYAYEDFILSAEADSLVLTRDPYLKEGRLSFSSGRIDTDLDISVNGSTYDGLPLKRGDQIEYLGIRIFFYGEFLYINHFMMDIHLPSFSVRYSTLCYARPRPGKVFYKELPAKPLLLPEFKEFKPLDKTMNTSILRSVLPSLVMSFSVAIVLLLSGLESRDRLFYGTVSLTYVISPLAMALTGVILPLVFYFIDRKKERKKTAGHEERYLNYLKDYMIQVDAGIEDYTKSLFNRSFSGAEEKKTPFYLNEKDADFLCITVGKIYEKYSFLHQTGIEKIDVFLRKLEDRFSHIGPVPLFLDLKKEKLVTIVSSKKDRQYFFLRFLLDMAYRHDFDELHVAVYSEDAESISLFYDLPHMFIGKKRLFITKERDLQLLDQLVLRRPLILFALSRVPFAFRNPQIRVLYFSEEMNDVLKNSDAIIEYLGNSAYLYAEERKEFSFSREAFDFNGMFRQLSAHGETLTEKKKTGFYDLFSDFDIRKSYEALHEDLRADFAFSDDQPLYFDLHQNRQGPHGLIGGSTGSGKSELIISLLLSLCIRYSPEYLNIILIDYKGGGIKEALTYNGICIPHVVAAISNLEGNTLERLVIALRNLSLERQRLFRELSEKGGLPIRDLDEYEKADLKAYGLKKIPHLLIVVDEFAELRKSHPEQIGELVSISRVGRSLGIHLILSTQKPAGNISEEIWSNARFKIALKVYEEKDSVDLIGKKDAALLKGPGDFLLRVDDRLICASGIFSGNDVNGNEPYEVCLLREDLEVEERKRIVAGKQLSEAAFFLKKILHVCAEMGIQGEKIDFLPPAPMKRRKLARGPCVVLGEIDDYLHKRRGLLGYGLKEDLLICSRRMKEAAAIFNTLNENRRRCIFIASRRYQGITCADSFLYEEGEDIGRLFEILTTVNEETTLLIEDLSVLFAYDEGYRQLLLKLLKQKDSHYLSIIAVSSDIQIGFKVINAFSNRILIKNDDPSAVSCLFSMKSACSGDSFFCRREVCSFVPILNEDYVQEKTMLMPLLRRYPDRFGFALREGKCLLGYDRKNREEIYSDGEVTIASYDNELLDNYRNAYSCVEGIHFKGGEELKKMPEKLFWIGPGVFSQRVFTVGYRQDLKENEGIYFCEGKRKLLRCISNG